MILSTIELPSKIKEIRGDESRDRFGQRFGVSEKAVKSWENGYRIPLAQHLREMGIERVFLVKSV